LEAGRPGGWEAEKVGKKQDGVYWSSEVKPVAVPNKRDYARRKMRKGERKAGMRVPEDGLR